jgi:hypothetical protein
MKRSGDIAQRWPLHRTIRSPRTIWASFCINATGSPKPFHCSSDPPRLSRWSPSSTTISASRFRPQTVTTTRCGLSAALELNPLHATAWNNLGLVLNAAVRLPEAVTAYREAIACKPDFAQAHWNLSLALLTMGEYREGLARIQMAESIVELAGQERQYAGPRWDGVVRQGMKLLITAEQGLGDMLQFVRLVEPLARKGVTVFVSAPRALVSLLATAPGVARVFGPQDPLPAYDARAPLLRSRTRSESTRRRFPPMCPTSRRTRDAAPRSRRRCRPTPAAERSDSPGRAIVRMRTIAVDRFRSPRWRHFSRRRTPPGSRCSRSTTTQRRHR